MSECSTALSNSAKHLLIYLNNTSQDFGRTHIRIFGKKFLVFIQKTSQHVFIIPFSIITEHILVVLRKPRITFLLRDNFLKIISQYFCMSPPNIFKNSLQQFKQSTSQYVCKVHYVLSQKNFSNKNILSAPVKYIDSILLNRNF